MSSYDLFLSYHSSDRDALQTVRPLLEVRGVTTFLDQAALTAGLPWPQALEEALHRTRAVAVFIGPHGLGLWQKREMYFALDRQVQEEKAGRTFPVIPVLLPNADITPGFLFLNNWVDLRPNLTDAAALDALVRAVGGTSPLQPAELTIPVCPYRGLRAFREEDAAFFWGREAFTQRLLEATLNHSLVAVVGPSGSGKSSVMQAGLLPRLRRCRPPDKTWDAVTFTPGDRPFHRLAAALLPLIEPDLNETDRLEESQRLGERLVDGRVRLEDALERILAKSTGTDRLLLGADQFEELFTTVPATAQKPFVTALLKALKRVPMTVVLTLRADFYGQAIALDRDLSDHLERGVVNLGPMRREELERAIVDPASRVGLRFEPGLVARILEDVGEEPGNLPLLEFALTELWGRRQGGLLTHEAYQDSGGVAGAVAQRAEAEFAELIPEQQGIALRVFTRLVRTARSAEEGQDTRQRVNLKDLEPTALPVVQALAHADVRLLVTGRDEASGQETVEVAHEALIRGWARLRGWLDADREFLLWRQRLQADMVEWLRTHQDEGTLLRGAPLVEAEYWLAERQSDLTPNERIFIQASVALREQQQSREEQARRRKIHLVIGAAVTFFVLSVLAGVQWRRAERHRQRAEQEAAVARHQTVLATSRGLAAEARNHLHKQLDLALLLSVEAHRKAKTAEARQALYTALDAAHSTIFLHGHRWHIRSLAFSPDGQTLAVGDEVGTLLLWDLRVSPPRSTSLPGHRREIWSLAFSPDGQTSAVGDEVGTLLLWDLRVTPPRATPLSGHLGSVRPLVFSPDGKRLASGDIEGTLLLWDLEGISPRSTSLPHQVGVQAFTFLPDGKTLAAVDNRGTLQAWDLSDTSPSQIFLPPSQDDMRTFTFSPNGRSLAMGSITGTLLLWDLRMSPPTREAIPGHQNHVRALALSADNNILASGDQNSTLLLWDLRGTSPVSTPLHGYQSAIWRLALSPDGTLLASSDSDGKLLLWDLRAPQPRATPLPGHQGAVETLVFSPDGKTLASRDSKGMFRLWDLRAPPPVRPSLRSHWDGVGTFTFSPDGQTLAFVDYDYDGGALLFWDLRRLPPVRAPLFGHRGEIQTLFFSPDGSMLAVQAADNKPLLWNLRETPPRSTLLAGHQSAVDAIALSPDGNLLASDGGKGTLLLWDLSATPPRSTTLLGHQENIWKLIFSPDSKLLASSDGSSLLLWDVGVTPPRSTPLPGHSASVTAFTFSPDGQMLAAGGAAGMLHLWDLRVTPSRSTVLPGHQGRVQHLAFSPQGKKLVSGDEKGTLLLWDVSVSPPRSTSLPAHPGYRRVFTFSPDGKILALNGEAGTLLLWDVSETPPRSLSLSGHQHSVQALAFSPDGQTLASGDFRGTLRLWDLRRTPPRSLLLPGYQETVRAFTFSPDGRILAASDEKGTLLLWDLSIKPPVSMLLPHDLRLMKALTFSPDSKTLVTSGSAGPLLWNVDFDSWPEHACRIANRNLTCAEWLQFMQDEPYRPTCAHLPFDTCEARLTNKATFK